MDITGMLVGLPAWGVYSAVAALGLTEGALGGIVLPGATTLVAVGVLSASGLVSLPGLMIVAVLTTLVGDSLGYALGRRLGPSLETSRLGRLVGAKNWQKTRNLLATKGLFALVAGRWIGMVRAIVPVVAGAGGMPYRKFLLGNVLGVATYVPAMIVLGYAGPVISSLLSPLAVYAPYGLAGAIAAIVVVLLARRLHSRALVSASR